jgi:hypothetical protein
MTKFVPHPKKNNFNPNILLGGRLKHKDIENRRVNAEAILCLLKPEELGLDDEAQREGAGSTYEWKVRNAGYIWSNWPSDARPWSSVQSTPEHWRDVAFELNSLLENYGRVYVHCAAGIHRTGIAAYTWYRQFLNLDHKEAFYYIVKHRPVIETDIGEKLLPMRHYFDRL